MQIVSIGDNLHQMSNLFKDNKQNKSNISSAESFIQQAKCLMRGLIQRVIYLLLKSCFIPIMKVNTLRAFTIYYHNEVFISIKPCQSSSKSFIENICALQKESDLLTLSD